MRGTDGVGSTARRPCRTHHRHEPCSSFYRTYVPLRAVTERGYPRSSMLRIVDTAYRQMIGHALDGLPDEACGLLAGRPTVGKVERFVACRKADASARTY